MSIRRLVVIGVVVVLLVWGVISCYSYMQSSTVSLGSPVGAAKGAIEAMESMEPAKVTAYFTPIPGALMGTRLINTYKNITKLDIQNLNAMLVLNEGSAARVEVTYDMVFTTSLGQISTEHCSKIIKLVFNESKDKWLINEVF